MAHMRPTSFLSTLAMINVAMLDDYRFEEEIPPGIGAIAAHIRRKGFPVEIRQCLPDDGAREIARAGQVVADVYGLQLGISNYPSVRAVAKIIRHRNPRALIVLCGPYLSCQAAPIIENEPLFDCAVSGDGEATMLEIMEAVQRGELDLGLIDGLVIRGPDSEAINARIVQMQTVPGDRLSKLPWRRAHASR